MIPRVTIRKLSLGEQLLCFCFVCERAEGETAWVWPHVLGTEIHLLFLCKHQKPRMSQNGRTVITKQHLQGIYWSRTWCPFTWHNIHGSYSFLNGVLLLFPWWGACSKDGQGEALNGEVMVVVAELGMGLAWLKGDWPDPGGWQREAAEGWKTGIPTVLKGLRVCIVS